MRWEGHVPCEHEKYLLLAPEIVPLPFVFRYLVLDVFLLMHYTPPPAWYSFEIVKRDGLLAKPERLSQLVVTLQSELQLKAAQGRRRRRLGSVKVIQASVESDVQDPNTHWGLKANTA